MLIRCSLYQLVIWIIYYFGLSKWRPEYRQKKYFLNSNKSQYLIKKCHDRTEWMEQHSKRQTNRSEHLSGVLKCFRNWFVCLEKRMVTCRHFRNTSQFWCLQCRVRLCVWMCVWEREDVFECAFTLSCEKKKVSKEVFGTWFSIVVCLQESL